ncbi:protein ABHD11-like [Neocloeon triangulifer]|uniref:protein ABHD11-like n=1 Tax=Neocloeon triangulifer TaxID=2078957 RepID=UPI00286EFE4D|nr:protein ABHD11-like [Neocloeon triangulifer]
MRIISWKKEFQLSAPLQRHFSSAKFTTPQTDRIQPIQMAYSSYELTSIPSISPLIIMHGLLGSKSNWRSLSKSLHAQTCRRVVAVDARNHGESPHNENHSYRYMAEDLRALLTLLEIDRAVLLGHSMGGRAMMLTALLYPNLVKGLIVVDTSPIRTSESINLVDSFLEAMRKIELPPKVPILIAKNIADRQLSTVVKDIATRQFLLTNLLETEEGDCKWRVNLDVLQRYLVKQVANFPLVTNVYNGPTLFIKGALSDYIKDSDAEEIKRIFPNAEFERVEGAGHSIHSDQPSKFVQIVSSFLKKLT